MAGTGVGISDELISLEITSPDVPNLTLIDLPGIARVAVKGQPENIGEQVCLSSTHYSDPELNAMIKANEVFGSMAPSMQTVCLYSKGVEILWINSKRNKSSTRKKQYITHNFR